MIKCGTDIIEIDRIKDAIEKEGFKKRVYTEKEILGDALNSEKNATTLYNLGANECVHDNLRETMLDLLAKEHDIQVDVFNQMHTMGYYPTPAAEAKKVQEAKTKFECGFKAV